MKSHFHRGNFFCHNFFMPHEFWLLLNVILLCKIHKIQFKQLKKEVTIIFLVWYGRVREREDYIIHGKKGPYDEQQQKIKKCNFGELLTLSKNYEKKTCSLRASYHNVLFITCTTIFQFLACCFVVVQQKSIKMYFAICI